LKGLLIARIRDASWFSILELPPISGATVTRTLLMGPTADVSHVMTVALTFALGADASGMPGRSAPSTSAGSRQRICH